ncbi:uncharacterized protein LOC119668868 isoform X2 [Teleopsis dalmanni]|uniref:uncharacterized protein LOC119668868 isoform X2 n=1 Tax=Teleopsis dalmanni TaxID=139649 RepID=UPI0018CE8699|nr:uncharacterized protein LOC119668868 isoform X2 [Teleopsis dalmanni]
MKRTFICLAIGWSTGVFESTTILLSTKLPQNGREFTGILGFSMRDIRHEIKLAKQRFCVYCEEQYASIECHECKQCFHLECGLIRKCLFQFFGEFRSYCDLCLPLDDTQSKLVNTPPSSHTRCYMCEEAMGVYCPTIWIYGKCCGKGYVHRICMQKYASNAGYYLKCIWCKGKEFREKVKEQGICVPDRDAKWEQKGAFNDLHRGHKRCDVETCLCPRGREYIGHKVAGKWNIIKCTLCGSFGGHSPCIMGNLNFSEKVKGFKCELCAKTEACLQQQNETCSQGSVCSYLSDMDNAASTNKFQEKRKCFLQNESDTAVSKSSNQKSCDEMKTGATCKEMLIENLETVKKSTAKDKDNELDRSVFQIKWQSFQQNDSHINEAHSFTGDTTVSNNSHQNLEADVASEDMSAESLKCIHISCSTSIIKLTPLVIQNSEQNVERHDTDVLATESQNIETEDMLNQNDDQCNPTENIGSVVHNSDEESDEIESISDICTEEVDSYSTISGISYDSENEESGDIKSISDFSLNSEEFNVSDISIDSSQNEDTEGNVFKQSSIISSPSHATQTIENVTCYDMYEFDDEMNCLGTCTVRIDFKDPRFTDKSIEEIQKTNGLIEERDVIARNSDIGEFAQINVIIT